MEWVALAALGGLLGIDETSAGQTMVSRPLVAASLAGLLLGSLPNGFLLGVLLECIYVSQLQVGGSRVPDGASAAVVGATIAVLEPTPAGVALGLVAALFIGDIGGRIVVVYRRWCGRVVPLKPGVLVPPGHLGRLHLMLTGVDFARGMALTTFGLITAPLWVALAQSWPLGTGSTLGLLAVAGAGTLGVSWGGGTPGRLRLLLLGVGLLASLTIGVA